jgi:hypothetical protein
MKQPENLDDVQQELLQMYAFPGRQMVLIGNTEMEVATQGLSKREYFAAKAMQAIIQHHGLPDGWTDEDIRIQLKSASMAAVACADALMTELTKTETK